MTSRREQITLQPAVLRWARERAGIEPERLASKMQVSSERVVDWERTGTISVAQVDKLAHHTHTPLGFLYLPEPPEDRLPIPDFRTRGARVPRRPSPNLLEMVYLMQRRQLWMRDELIAAGFGPLAFVGAYQSGGDPREVAAAMRDILQLAREWASEHPTWTDALGYLRDQAEDAGVIVVLNGIVDNDTHRKLDRDEFQGFALVDQFAPLIFVNGADFKAAQMFTLAHELAHLFVGETGVSLFEDFQPSSHATERFCDQAAAEFLVPAQELHDYWPFAERSDDPYQSIARQFKVSTIVAMRRALDLELIDRQSFLKSYGRYLTEERRKREARTGGGNFWNTQKWRVGPRFGGAVVRAVKRGRLPYREAYGLTGLKGDTFESMPQKMGLLF